MPSGSMRTTVIVLAILTFAVFLSRVPFLEPGYGSDADCWLMISAARTMTETGRYCASRFPGNPIPEIALAFYWKAGPFVCNAVAAALSAVVFLFFTLILRFYRCRDWLLAGLTFALAPVIYVNSTMVMDYMWAMSCTLASMYCVLKKRPIIAGVLLGLAIGSRITSGAMLFPLLILWTSPESRPPWKSMLLFTVCTLGMGAITYIPSFMVYGFRFLSFYEPGEYPPWYHIGYRLTGGCWGLWASVFLVIAFIVNKFLKKKDVSLAEVATGDRVWWSWMLVIILYMISFMRLPHEPGYLIPLVPFAILLAAQWLTRPLFQGFCALVILSSFIGLNVDDRGNPIRVYWKGAIFKEMDARRAMIDKTEKMFAKMQNAPPHSVFITGRLMPAMLVKLDGVIDGDPKVIYGINKDEVEKYPPSQYVLFYVDEAERQFNEKVFGVDLAKLGATAVIDKQQ